MKEFRKRLETDEGFRNFIEVSNKDEVLFDFTYELYLKFKTDTISIARNLVNENILNIDNIIEHYEKNGEFERCQKLIEIKKIL